MGGAGIPTSLPPLLLLVPPSPFLIIFLYFAFSVLCVQQGKEGGSKEPLVGSLPQDGSQKPYSEWAVLEPRRAASLSVGE